MKRILLSILLYAAAIFPAAAQNYYDIDVDLPSYPEMQPVPDSPVYYAPTVDSNYFYYDGVYWDYNNDGWYASTWYNGPWEYVDPVYVPTYVLWVPIYYYRRPPAYFRGWRSDRPPRWGQHWGNDWQNRHNAIYGTRPTSGQRAPLPQYQAQYNRNNYPRNVQQQYAMHAQNYAYRPQGAWTSQHYQQRGIVAQTQPQGQAPEGKNPAARGATAVPRGEGRERR
jgi:hypothetical protein